MSEIVERVARAIADRHGDNWDDIPKHKSHWTEQRGQFGGRFRDINERFQCSYLDEARTAIAAMREPTEGMLSAGAEKAGYDYGCYLETWQAMIDEALK